eukprot:272456_1
MHKVFISNTNLAPGFGFHSLLLAQSEQSPFVLKQDPQSGAQSGTNAVSTGASVISALAAGRDAFAVNPGIRTHFLPSYTEHCQLAFISNQIDRQSFLGLEGAQHVLCLSGGSPVDQSLSFLKDIKFSEEFLSLFILFNVELGIWMMNHGANDWRPLVQDGTKFGQLYGDSHIESIGFGGNILVRADFERVTYEDIGALRQAVSTLLFAVLAVDCRPDYVLSREFQYCQQIIDAGRYYFTLESMTLNGQLPTSFTKMLGVLKEFPQHVRLNPRQLWVKLQPYDSMSTPLGTSLGRARRIPYLGDTVATRVAVLKSCMHHLDARVCYPERHVPWTEPVMKEAATAVKSIQKILLSVSQSISAVGSGTSLDIPLVPSVADVLKEFPMLKESFRMNNDDFIAPPFNTMVVRNQKQSALTLYNRTTISGV